MNKKCCRLLVLLLTFHLVAASGVRADDTLRVCTYNALNFRGPQDADRYDDFRIIMRAINPDLVVMQEIISEDAVDGLLSFVFLQLEDDWAAAIFTDGPDTDNAFFYRTSKAALVLQRIIPTTLRDIAEYVVRPVSPDTSMRLRLYSAHLKASQGADNENRRLQEATALRQQLNLLSPGALFIVGGDFNLYRSSEPAYEYLLSPGTDPDGQLFDPINTPGDWHANAAFAAIHTQSSRSSLGGLDDRFDFLLVSAGLMDTVGSRVLPATYTAFGNDGRHFNQSINDGSNWAVPDSVADALFNGADHLPVFVDIVLRTESSSVSGPRSAVESHELLRCYPNPFNPSLTVQLSGVAESVTVSIHDVTGRLVDERVVPAGAFTRPLEFDFSNHPAGSYFVRARTMQRSEVRRVLLLR